ncbi:MAG: hypothetical protein R3E97_01425 [Candidatus Eisenbacteria bacterium]
MRAGGVRRRESIRSKDYHVSDLMLERLAAFDRESVLSTLRTMLRANTHEGTCRIILDVLGHIGNKSDLAQLNEFIASGSEFVANAAFDAKQRLTDPLRLPDQWY